MKKRIYLIPMIAIFLSCSHKITTTTNSGVVAGYSGATAKVEDKVEDEPLKPVLETRKPESAMPKASAFKMNGNFSDNVAITLNEQGEISYFPDPTDITPSARPTDLGNGWWLNNQGIGPNSVFTKYTFEEYSKLPQVPSAEELKAAIIPGSAVTEMIALPYNIGEASGNIEEIKDFLKNR